MRFELARTYQEFLNIEKEWNEVLHSLERYEIFYRYEWAKCYVEYYDNSIKDNIFIVLGIENNKCVIILPFILNRGTITFITNETTDYNGIYVSRNVNRYVTIKKAIEYLIDNVDVLQFDLKEIPSGSELYILNDVLEKLEFKTFIKMTSIAPIVKENQEEKFQKKKIKDIERRERKLSDKCEIIYKDENYLSQEVFEFIASERKKKYEDSNLHIPHVSKFYSELFKNLGENTFVSSCYLDGKLVAAHMGFIDEKKIYYYIPAYDEQFSGTGIGMILLKHIFDNNYTKKTFDFLRGNEDYKFGWSDNINANFRLVAYKKSEKKKILLESLKEKKNIRILMGK